MAIHSAVEWGRNHFETPHVILSNVEHVATSAPVKYLASKQLIGKSVKMEKITVLILFQNVNILSLQKKLGTKIHGKLYQIVQI